MYTNYKKKYLEMEHENQRNRLKFALLNQWLKLKHHGIHLKEFLDDRQLGSVAVYGMGDMGRLILGELEQDGAGKMVKYGIDQNGEGIKGTISIYSLNPSLERVDAVIITPVLITDFIEDEIYKVLGEQRTYTLEEILYELSRKHRIPSDLWEI